MTRKAVHQVGFIREIGEIREVWRAQQHGEPRQARHVDAELLGARARFGVLRVPVASDHQRGLNAIRNARICFHEPHEVLVRLIAAHEQHIFIGQTKALSHRTDRAVRGGRHSRIDPERRHDDAVALNVEARSEIARSSFGIGNDKTGATDREPHGDSEDETLQR